MSRITDRVGRGAASLIVLAAGCSGEAAAPVSAPQAEPARPAVAALQAAASAEEIAMLRRDVQDLRRDLVELRAQMTRRQQATPGAEPVRPQAAAGGEAAEDTRWEDEQRIAAAEAAFRLEGYDATLGVRAAATVRQAIAGVPGDLARHLRGVECRQSCRVELQDAASPAVAMALPQLITRLASQLPSVTVGEVDQGDGTRSMVLYLSR